jgi:hypothetical protein
VSKIWTVISVDRISGTTRNHIMVSGFDTTEARGMFSTKYPREDMLALISGHLDVQVYNVPQLMKATLKLAQADVVPIGLPSAPDP